MNETKPTNRDINNISTARFSCILFHFLVFWMAVATVDYCW